MPPRTRRLRRSTICFLLALLPFLSPAPLAHAQVPGATRYSATSTLGSLAEGYEPLDLHIDRAEEYKPHGTVEYSYSVSGNAIASGGDPPFASADVSINASYDPSANH